MNRVEIELNSEGIKELLKSEDMQSILSQYGADKARMAGTGYASEVHVFKRRAVVNIFPDTAEANKDNMENNTLLKVIGS